ncbi:MAG: helix-turn-helix transcriptional regulator [Clostridia bacterium]|nr:helix-turn-helix transcriptional regulator [Clostridia bacterium]
MKSEPCTRLGERVRKIRNEKGLTQKQLAGDRITRNMVSMIESGREFPSASTIAHISEILDTPAGYFFASTPEEENMYEKQLVISRLKKDFYTGNYDSCIRILSSCPEESLDDEMLFIYARAVLRTSVRLAGRMNITDAVSKLAEAEQIGSRTEYCGNSFRKAIEYYAELFRTVCSDDITDKMTDISACGPEVPSDIVSYFINLKLVRSGDEISRFCPVSGFHLTHIKAVDQMLEEEYPDSLRALRNLADNEQLPFYMRFRVLCDLETAATAARDMSDAYYASKQKLDMIAEFSPKSS